MYMYVCMVHVGLCTGSLVDMNEMLLSYILYKPRDPNTNKIRLLYYFFSLSGCSYHLILLWSVNIAPDPVLIT